MTEPARLGYPNLTLAQLNFSQFTASGRLAPRLIFHVTAQTREKEISARILHLTARIEFNGELFGVGLLFPIGELITHHERQFSLEIQITREELTFIQENFRDHRFSLSLTLSGLMQILDERPLDQRRDGNRSSVGAWDMLPFDHVRWEIGVAQSDWIKNILEPTGFGEYILLNLPLPAPPHRERWQQAIDHLKEAEAQFLLGNDAEVLNRCHAAFETLGRSPAAFEQLFAPISDESKRKDINVLLKQTKGYLNAGRHVNRSGEDVGTFAVDHRDAEFAVGMTKLFLNYLAKLLPSNEKPS